jgi:predicted ATPase
MHDDFQHDSRVTKLDPDLLSTPFEIQTNWHVITGTSCCGKTTLIDQLAAEGFQTVAETARQYFEEELARGRTIDEVRDSGIDLERHLLDLQLGAENALRAIDVVFLDRALPDCLTFYRFNGDDPNEILSECFHHRYASVFILDPLPYQQDQVRLEDEAERDFLDVWLARDYATLGYDVVRAPVLSPEERLAFVLENLSERGLI